MFYFTPEWGQKLLLVADPDGNGHKYELQAAEGEEVFDASGKYVTPGMIDAHSHICISEEGMGSIGDDCCDYSGALTPELEVLDGIYPFDRAVIDSVRAGVTAACVCPGSDGVVGGVASTITLNGTVADEMLLRRYTAMKCSVGENPKTAKHGFESRMGVAYHLRKCLEDAIEYRHDKEEAEKSGSWFKRDIGMENMLKVLNKEMPRPHTPAGGTKRCRTAPASSPR